jgi:hypothetical protein
VDELNSLLNPVPPEVAQPQVAAPTSPEEFQTRKSGWTQIVDAMRSNPNIAQGLLFAGAKMLQAPRFGQSSGGAIAEGLFGGMQMYGALEQNRGDQQRADQEFALKTEESKALTENRRASTESTKVSTDKARQMMGSEIAKANLDAEVAALDAKLKKIDFDVESGITTAERVKSKREAIALELNAKRAQAAASFSAAGASDALAAGRRAENKWIDARQAGALSGDLSQTAERLSQTSWNLGGRKGGGAGTSPEKTEQAWARLDHTVKGQVVKAYYDAKNKDLLPRPEMTVQEFHQEVWEGLPSVRGGSAKPASPAGASPNRRVPYDPN